MQKPSSFIVLHVPKRSRMRISNLHSWKIHFCWAAGHSKKPSKSIPPLKRDSYGCMYFTSALIIASRELETERQIKDDVLLAILEFQKVISDLKECFKKFES